VGSWARLSETVTHRGRDPEECRTGVAFSPVALGVTGGGRRLNLTVIGAVAPLIFLSELPDKTASAQK
jgi:class 3 adenylate cyclase